MLEKFLKSTENLFDKKLKNGTIMVIIISTLITITGVISTGLNNKLTTNVLQTQKNTIITSYIILDGKKYKIILEEIK